MNMIQLDPSIPVIVKDKGPAEAIAIFEYGQDKDVQWLVFLEDNGQSIFVNGRDVKKHFT